MQIKRDLLRRTIEEDPEPEAFEAWLLQRGLAAPASGPVQALSGEIFEAYRPVQQDPGFIRCLAAGSPGADKAEE